MINGQILFLFLVSIIFLSCNSGKSKYAILDYDSVDSIFVQLQIEKFTKANLNAEEIGLLQEVLINEMKAFNQKEKEWRMKLDSDTIERTKYELYIGSIDEYWCQYVPMYDSNGEKVVHVNCFCDEPYDDSLKHAIVDYLDGGRCSFQIRILLSKRKGVRMKVNGTAAIHNSNGSFELMALRIEHPSVSPLHSGK
jgi:hypothetical protein